MSDEQRKIDELKEQLAATELCLEKTREALEDIALIHENSEDNSMVSRMNSYDMRCVAREALQLQPSLSALREHDEEVYQRGRADEAYDRN